MLMVCVFFCVSAGYSKTGIISEWISKKFSRSTGYGTGQWTNSVQIRLISGFWIWKTPDRLDSICRIYHSCVNRSCENSGYGPWNSLCEQQLFKAFQFITRAVDTD